MSGPWSLTPADLAAARANTVNTATSIDEQLGVLSRYVDGLAAEWQGPASSGFGALMAEYHAHAANLSQTLESIAQNLQSNHDAVVGTEHLNVKLMTPHDDAGTDLRPPRF